VMMAQMVKSLIAYAMASLDEPHDELV
jgi:hypothetical protein